MEIEQMRYFLSVAETGSFTTAAENLYISQSSLSKRILALEKELGVQLFDRSKRKISLTPAGETLIEYAVTLNKTYQNMIAGLEEYQSAAAPLSIAAIPVIAQYGITSFIAQFKRMHPRIRFTLEERLVSAILPGLDSYQYDLAFIRDNYLDKDSYTCLEISKDRLVLVVSEQSHYAARPSVSLAELSGENFIMYDKGTIIHKLTLDACHSAGFDPQIFHASLRVDNIISLVASNIGVALLMQKVFDYHDHSGVTAIPLDKVIESNIIMASLKDVELSESAQTFVELVTRALNGQTV